MSYPFVPFGGELVSATFLRREKRFLAHMLLADGSETVAHCPNTGSMRSCLEEGAEAVLQRSANPDRKLAYTWKAVRVGGVWIGIDTSIPNRLVEAAVREGFIPALAGYPAVEREKALTPGTSTRPTEGAPKWIVENKPFPEASKGPPPRSRHLKNPRMGVFQHTVRIDLRLSHPEKPVCFVEVKNVTLVEGGLARFPDAVTVRGARHLEELSRHVEAGGRAAMVYLVQRADGAAFCAADDIDPAYGEAFRAALARGVEMFALSAEVTTEGVRAKGLLPISR